MQFDSPFRSSKISPRKNRQAQINRRRIQRVKGVLETELVARRQMLTMAQQLSKQRFMQAIGLVFIHARKVRAC